MEERHAARDTSIDLIKVIAIIGVVTIHTCIGGYAYPIGSWNWGASLFWGCITRASVPLFFMCSGALLLDPHHALSLKKLYSKNILRVLTALLFWAMAYKIFNLLIAGTFSVSTVFQAVKEVILFKHEDHLYYIHIILLVYAFLPITRVFVQNANKKLMEYALALWFILGILFPTVKVFWPFSLLIGIPLQWMLNMTYASIGYGILGYYMKRYRNSEFLSYLVIGFLGFFLSFGATWYGSVQKGVLYQHFLEGMTCGVAFLAVGIFGACITWAEKRELSSKIGRVLTYGSKASFCIFLVHVFFLKIFPCMGLSVNVFPCLISIPLLVILNLVCSIWVYWILSHVVILKKWVV
jgi:surface polysaccharide O-acyltransferase-like enzyme